MEMFVVVVLTLIIVVLVFKINNQSEVVTVESTHTQYVTEPMPFIDNETGVVDLDVLLEWLSTRASTHGLYGRTYAQWQKWLKSAGVQLNSDAIYTCLWSGMYAPNSLEIHHDNLVAEQQRLEEELLNESD